MGSTCKFCGISYSKLSRRHKCSYALYNKGVRHGAATVKSRETRQPSGWSVPTWGGYRSQDWPDISGAGMVWQ
jgi:hypothetical protein